MRYVTNFKAIDQTSGDLKRWSGATITADSFQEAETICKESYPYLIVIGELIGDEKHEIKESLES